MDEENAKMEKEGTPKSELLPVLQRDAVRKFANGSRPSSKRVAAVVDRFIKEFNSREQRAAARAHSTCDNDGGDDDDDDDDDDGGGNDDDGGEGAGGGGGDGGGGVGGSGSGSGEPMHGMRGGDGSGSGSGGTVVGTGSGSGNTGADDAIAAGDAAAPNKRRKKLDVSVTVRVTDNGIFYACGGR